MVNARGDVSARRKRDVDPLRGLSLLFMEYKFNFSEIISLLGAVVKA